jgi:hypothetical protein
LPGEALLALLKKTGFQGLKLVGYTGMKSSPYTEGALLSGEKPGLGLSRKPARPAQEPPVASPEPVPQPESPGGS